VNDHGEAFALGASRGQVVWKRQTGPTRSGVLVMAGRVVIATLRDSLITLDRETGAVAGAFALRVSTAAPLAMLDDSTVVIASPQGTIDAVSISTGRVRWTVTVGEPIPGAPVVHADTVFALGGSCTLIRVPRHAPNVFRRDPAPHCVTVATPLLLRDGVLVATVAGEVTYISRATGTATWTRRTGGTIRHPPLVLDRQIVLATLGGEIFGFR
jgi:outer membrane protein assembly factor BamB